MSELLIMRDGEVDPDYQPKEPTVLEALGTAVKDKVAHVTGELVLQARMALYDAQNDTNYRQIRNELMAQKRREQFERSIGLVALHR